MKVLFECQGIVPNNSGGIENYTYMLVNAWNKCYPEDTITLNIPPDTSDGYKKNIEGNVRYITDPVWLKRYVLSKKSIVFKIIFKIIQSISPFLHNYFNGYRRKWHKVVDDNSEIIICTFHKTKIMHDPAKMILVVHDFRSWDYKYESIALKKTIPQQTEIIEKAAHVVVAWPYPFMKMLELFPEKGVATTMIPFLFDPFKRSNIANEKGNYLYYSSNNAHHKNHENLIKALAIYNNRNENAKLKLICTGPTIPARTKTLAEIINKVGQNENITFLGFVDRDKVNELYKNCFAVITTTKYEAFSGTILEAFGHQKAVIGSSIPANTEFMSYYGLGVKLFDPDSPEEIARAIEDVRNNYNEHEMISKSGFSRLKHITPEYTVTKFKEIARELY
jgi:glycosyltransferase involved in cell wall biosynthesis